jgi:ATP-dependent DNA ligase
MKIFHAFGALQQRCRSSFPANRGAQISIAFYAFDLNKFPEKEVRANPFDIERRSDGLEPMLT